MKKTKSVKKKSQKKAKANANASKKVAAKSKAGTRKKGAAKSKTAPKSRARRARVVQASNQNVETVQMKPRRMTARAGAGGGDFGGTSVVEDVDSESPDELLEEGQAFEAGIVQGVEEADINVEQEVHTHEVPQDDVPEEYDDKDRP
jgi:hypothetical protein